ncbi:MAG: hypothetical protein JW704_09805 [Anaerolineaceae bacterium]|nr:hypothetical protein [Anaerolineaceae bacterium]
MGKKTVSKKKKNPLDGWSPLVFKDFSIEEARHGLVARFENSMVRVDIKETPPSIFTDFHNVPVKMAQLIVYWKDPVVREMDLKLYRLRQQIKAETCGPNSEYAELGPAPWRDLPFTSTHLWVLPPGSAFPVGIIPEDVEGAIAESVGGHENVVTREDLELFVVRYTEFDAPDGEMEITEVFASEEECKAVYGEAGIPESATTEVGIIGSVPGEGATTAWSNGAKKKVASIIAKSQSALMSLPSAPPQLFYDKDTLEDELWPGLDDDGRGGLEDEIALVFAMQEAMEGKAQDRAARLREVTRGIIARSDSVLGEAKAAAKKPLIVLP